MGFRLVPKSATLNDFERRNDRVLCVISPNSVALGQTYYVTWLKIHQFFLRVKCSPHRRSQWGCSGCTCTPQGEKKNFQA